MTLEPQRPGALSRARTGRVLAGVCAGLARHRALSPGAVRAAFALAALVGGLGVLVYLACWLIVPAEGEDDTSSAGLRGIVILAQGCAACAGLATLGAAAAAAAIFGFGWVVLIVGAVILAAALGRWPAVGPAWVLLPLAALVVPAVAMAVGGVRIAAQTGDVAIAPRSATELAHHDYRSGLGMLLIDLRHTTLPATGGVVALQIDAGVRRTIVALPADRCVQVDLRYHVVRFAAHVASIVSGGSDAPFSQVTVFGQPLGAGRGETGSATPTPRGPLLNIDFHSAGGSLYVRDYPDGVDPRIAPDWPGYPVALEPRPDTTGTPHAAALTLIRNWLVRRREQRQSAAAINHLMPGPCASGGQGA